MINKILAHNGCILADSVGLGKTYEALAVGVRTKVLLLSATPVNNTLRDLGTMSRVLAVHSFCF